MKGCLESLEKSESLRKEIEAEQGLQEAWLKKIEEILESLRKCGPQR